MSLSLLPDNWKPPKDKPKPKPSAGGRTPSEAALGESMEAAGNAVSPTNTNVAAGYPAPTYTRPAQRPGSTASPYERPVSLAAQLISIAGTTPDARSQKALPSVVIDSALEQIQRSNKPELTTSSPRRVATPAPVLVKTALRTLAQAAEIRDTPRGNVIVGFREKTKNGGERVRRAQFGKPTVTQLAEAGEDRKLRVTGKGKVATVPQIRAAGQLKGARQVFRQAVKEAKGAPRRELVSAGLTPEQAKVLSTILRIGDKMGATRKEKLSAVETALVESNIANLSYGDADSAGWRQERAMYYPNPTNLKASARRYFEETAAAGRGAGITAGDLAQSVQRSAFPDKYDERRADALPLLEAYDRAPMKAVPGSIKRDLRRSTRRAQTLGVPGVGGGERAEGPSRGGGGGSKYAYPLSVRGVLGSTPADHALRAFGNWMSDNAVDISIPVGTPVRAVTDAVVTRISGSPPNHAANPAGWTVYLRDDNGEEYSYMHLDGYSVKAGDRVKRGQRLGVSGAANGVPHLHFATMNGDPQAVIEGGSSAPAKPKFVNFSKKGGPGTSQSRWLVPTGGNEVLKFQRPLANALIKLAKASGEPIKINSAFRSYAEQAALYEAYQNGTGNLAAPPGQSNHEGGVAADVELTPRQRELAPQFGLGFPVAGEDWHIELVGEAANAIVDPGAVGGGGPTTSAYGGPSNGAPGQTTQQQQTAAPELGEIPTYGSLVTSSLLPQAYVDLVMSAGTDAGDSLLSQFIGERATPRRRR